MQEILVGLYLVTIIAWGCYAVRQQVICDGGFSWRVPVCFVIHIFTCPLAMIWAAVTGHVDDAVCRETKPPGPPTKLQQQLKEMRTLTQEMGWSEFMAHVAALMAEQTDKTSGKQSASLFACSTTLRALHDCFDSCGHFTYPKDMVITR